MTPTQPPLGATPEPSANKVTIAEARAIARSIQTNAEFRREVAAALDYADNGDRTETDPIAVLAEECRLLTSDLATARAALAQCEERVKCARRLRAESISSAEWTAQLDLQAKTEAALALCEKSRRDEESWWKEKHDYQARAESAEAVIKQITEGHPNAALVCELRTRAIDAESKLAQCEDRLAEMTARAMSLALHVPPETLCGAVQQWRDEVKAQLAAHAKALEDGKRHWQPMETAPKDGTTILAHFPARVGYTARQDIIPIHWSGWGGGVWENSTSGSKPSDNPTHWMPLPSAPATTEKEHTL